MLTKYITLLLVLLPAATFAGIVIKIKPTKNGNDTSVDFFGEDLADINDKDRELFKIDDETLEKATKTFIGKRCTNVFLKPPTPWGDVHKKYGWNPVRRIIKPIEAKVIGVYTKPVFVGSVTQPVDETVAHTWTTGGEFGVEQEITYEIKFGDNSVGDNSTMSYTSSWGEDTTKSRTVTLGTTSTIMTEVPPGTSVEASLVATQNTVDIEIRYSTELTGKLFCNYEVPYRRHHFYALPINELLNVTGIPLFKYSTEKISVSFYTSVKLDVTNSTVS